jgi:hypothetical protein
MEETQLPEKTEPFGELVHLIGWSKRRNNRGEALRKKSFGTEFWPGSRAKLRNRSNRECKALV